MSKTHFLLRGLSALVSVAVLGACGAHDNQVLGPAVPAGGSIFSSYVSLGNSITAGYQSGGINDSTQRQAYPVLLARQMGTSFVYPSLAMPGCTPPIANFQTGALVGNAPSNTCALRNPALVSDRINNVAVPGATSADPFSPSTNASNALTTLFLGGMTQDQRALQAHPTFATDWIGNNDVLAPALSGILASAPGISPGVTPVATFVSNYAKGIDPLVAGAPGLKGVLIGVVQVGAVPAFVSGGLIWSSPALQGAITQASGLPPRGLTVLPNCSGSISLIDVIQLIPQIRQFVATNGASGHPPVISCEKGQFPPSPLVGDIFVLDSQEQATLFATISAYNAYIKAKADSIGFAYVDPNPLLAALKASGAIPLAPNFASPTAPFGQYISLDGIHPSAAAHVLIANAIIDAINGKYGTALRYVQ